MNSSYLSEKIRSLEKTEPDLKAFAEKYPWCSLAQVSLLHHYQKNNSDKFQQQAKKTVLYFNNPGWLKWQLHLLATNPGIETEKDQISNQENPTFSKSEEIVEKDVTDSKTVIINEFSEVKKTESVIEFEPLHTTDYFASQGIKITDEPITQDKLGTQMKSFTEWLKSMKKIHKENFPAGDDQTDKSIQQIAEHSNEATEVVTESMADVLLKQGKKDKACEVYRKLSLINPSKSAYFTAKIQSLSTDSQI